MRTPMRRLAPNITSIAESATMAIDTKAKALAAAGHDVIGFAAGEPDFPTPAHIVEAAQRACAEPSLHHYSSPTGLPGLREAVAARTAARHGVAVQPSQVVVTNGSKQAVLEAFAAIVAPGDEVLVPSPHWVTYPEVLRWLGGVPVSVPADATSSFRVGVAALEAARTPRTKALLFASPTNPTGAVYSEEEVAAIAAWASDAGLWVVVDDIYDELVYGGASACPFLRAGPSMVERCIVLNGVSKTYAMTGWRVGWLVAPPDVASAAAKLHSHMTGNVCNAAQAAALAALTGPTAPVVEMRAAFDRRRKRMLEALARMGLDCVEPHGAFYAFPNVERCLDTEAPTSLDLAGRLLDVAGVAVVPGEAFGAPGHIRLSYALADGLLDAGLARLDAVLGEG